MAFSVTMMMSADGARRGVVGDEAEAAHASLGRRARGGGPFRRVASFEEAGGRVARWEGRWRGPYAGRRHRTLRPGMGGPHDERPASAMRAREMQT
jgi:hypothetical protein